MNLQNAKNKMIYYIKKESNIKASEIETELNGNSYTPGTFISEENQELLIEKATISGWFLEQTSKINSSSNREELTNISATYPYKYVWDSSIDTKYFIIPTADITNDMIVASVFDSIDKFQTSVDGSQKVVPVENPSSIFDSYTGYTWDVIDNVILSTDWYSQEEHDAKLLSLKKGKMGLVHMKTGNLIFLGMPYTVTINGVSKYVKFDMTERDQLNYTGLDNKKNILTYAEGTGQSIACKDVATGEKLYWYPSKADDMTTFTTAIYNFVNDYIKSDHVLENQIMATTTLAELGAIVDDRT